MRVFTFCPIYISGAGKKGHPDRGDSRSLFRGRPVRKTIVFGYSSAFSRRLCQSRSPCRPPFPSPPDLALPCGAAPCKVP
ncbi:hypothetical protein BEI64_03365 [Eisenbergiella tayi]|nr:hypothetical protein BEI64_03365 [Eisenbergiella tayi]